VILKDIKNQYTPYWNAYCVQASRRTQKINVMCSFWFFLGKLF